MICYSQNKPDTVLQIREVTVVANKYREVIPAQRLSGQELERLNSHSVADAIRYFAGVQIKDYGGIGGLKTVDIRSMGTNHMGVFYDGIQLGNAQNGQIDLGKFSLDNIEEISLYNGQKSEIFQPAKDFGSAGTIYLRTRKPRFEGDRKTNLKVLFRTGSFDLINPSVLWEQKITEHISSSFNAEFIDASGKYKFRYKKKNADGSTAWDTTAVRQNGDIRSYRLEGGINGYSDNSKWNIKAYFYDSEKGIPGAIVNNVWKRSQRQWDQNFFTQASYQKEITSKYDMQFNVKYANDFMHYNNPDTTLMYIDNHFRQQEIYASLANKYSILSNWDVSLSSDILWNTLDATLQDFVYPKRLTTLVSLASALEFKKFKAQASILGTFVNEKADRVIQKEGESESPPDKQEYTPAVFVSYKPIDKYQFNIRAFFKRIFRMPTFNDLYYTDIGNVNLRPEYTDQYNLGFQYSTRFDKLFETFDIRADVYYNEVTDKIIAVPKGNGQYRWMMMNIGLVKIRGIDVSAHTSCVLPKGISLNANVNYTYQKAQDYSYPEDEGKDGTSYKGQIAYIPYHNGSFVLGAIWKTWDLNYSFIYVGERWHNSTNIQANHEEAWYTSDMSAGKRFKIKNMRFKITAEVNNILNQHYDVVLNYPMPGRNWKMILKAEL